MDRQDIVDASGLIGLLLVFVFGYFSAVLPVVLALLDLPTPDVRADRQALASQIQSRAWVVRGLLVLDVLVLAWLLPLTVSIVRDLSFSGDFPTLEIGLLIMDAMLATLLVVTGMLLGRMRRRRQALLN